MADRQEYPVSSVTPMTRIRIYENAKVDRNYNDVVLPGWLYGNVPHDILSENFGGTQLMELTYVANLSFIDINKAKVKIDINNHNSLYPITDEVLQKLSRANYIYVSNFEWLTYDRSVQPNVPEQQYPYAFFGFIDETKYINMNTVEISFTLDIFTTYWGTKRLTDTAWDFPTTLYPCFVEREHSNSDAIGEHWIDEGLDTGDYVVAGDMLDLFGTWQVMVMASEKLSTTDPSGTEPPDPQTFANVFTPVAIYAGLNASQPQMIQQIINTYTELGKADSIINVVEYPSSFGTNQVAETTEPVLTMPTTIDGYTPKNKKLFCYPYNYLVGSNRSGSHAIFKWELWKPASKGSFKRYSCAIGNPTAILVPQDYRGITGDDYESAIMWQKSPVCPYNSDAYKAFWAQNKNQIGMSMGANLIQSISGAITAGIGLTMGNPLAVVGGGMTNLGGLMGVEQKLAKMQDYQAVPDQSKGNMNNDYIMAGKNLQGFQVFKMQIRAEMARIIDDYFTAYGYACKKVKVPNVGVNSHRANFCYIKTQGCKIKGDMPAPIKAQMEAIFDRGIRLWKNYTNYGNLNVTNNITS